ncbi:protein of unknown function [Nitrospira japonica]|uniref:DUF5666 domain-containing protein n=1 Tax=Nitrospira japonica TaxID=1325564 RepID=A0A1W1I682_9BACT|nr:hypothetical protein [Nitrospira japonica]SLM48485.1 protein of unknown function [Nitrospira japonica]
MRDRIVTPTWRWVSTAVMAISIGLLCVPLVQAAQGRTYKVQGIVIGVTSNQSPQLIVVNTPITPKNFMTVGATVTAQTKILRGQKKVPLHSIRVGESVWLTYIKSPEGLLARMIQAKG